jgi:hypothetical protein
VNNSHASMNIRSENSKRGVSRNNFYKIKLGLHEQFKYLENVDRKKMLQARHGGSHL